MPLDPHAKKLLNLLAASGRGSATRPTVEDRRLGVFSLMHSANRDQVAEGAVENASFSGPGGPLEIRVYTPHSAKDRISGALLYFHGGGWVAGGFDTHAGLCARLAQASGCRIAILDYRLSPEHKFPAALEDGVAAVEWLSAKADIFAIDPRRLGVCGDSAGANIAAGVCRLTSERGRRLALQAMLCPILDAVGDTESRRIFAHGYFLDQETLEDDLMHYCPPGLDRLDPRLSPLRADDFSILPPAHIHTAEFDPVRDEGRFYAEKLATAGISVTHKCHPGMIHLFYGMPAFIPSADAILRDVGVAIGTALSSGRP